MELWNVLMEEVGQLTWDLWRLVFSFLDLVDLPAIFCIRFFQPAWQHREFWLSRFLNDFPLHLDRISLSSSSHDIPYDIPWMEIREIYCHLIQVRGRHDPNRVNLQQLFIEDLQERHDMFIGNLSYSRHSDRVLRITTPVCTFPFALSNNRKFLSDKTPSTFTLKVQLTGVTMNVCSNEMKEFYNFFTRFQNRIIDLTAENCISWFGVQWTKEHMRFQWCVSQQSLHYDPLLLVHVPSHEGRVLAQLHEHDGRLMGWEDFQRGSKGQITIRCTSYFYKNGYFGVKWELERVDLEKEMDVFLNQRSPPKMNE